MSRFIQEQQYLGLVTRLKRLSDLLEQEQRKIYRDLGFELEPHWHLFLLLLEREGELSVRDFAENLNISHPAAVNNLKRMKERGLVLGRTDSIDRRKKFYRLSAQTLSDMPEYHKVWDRLAASIKTSGGSFLNMILSEMESSLTKKSLTECFALTSEV